MKRLLSALIAAVVSICGILPCLNGIPLSAAAADASAAISDASEDIQEIYEVWIENVTESFYAGDQPLFTAQSGDASRYQILTEQWSDGTHMIHSNPVYNAEDKLPAESRLDRFEEGVTYKYKIVAAAAEGYQFSDFVRVFVNGAEMPEPSLLNASYVGCDASITFTAKQPPITTSAQSETKPATTTTVQTTVQSVLTTASTAATVRETTAVSSYSAGTTVQETTLTTVTTTVTATEVLTTGPVIEGLLYGDLNQDGRCSLSDAVLLLRYTAEDNVFLLSEKGLSAADMDRNGIIDMADLRALLLLLKIQTAEPVPAKDLFSWLKESDFTDESGSPSVAAAKPPLRKPAGNSQAYTEEPFEGLKITVPEKALSYDGQLKISRMSFDEEKELVETVMTDEMLVVDGWSVEAGLSPDDHLPGKFRSEYDLAQLELPDSLYDGICVFRVDDEGGLYRIAANIDGDTLSWESDQNSAVVIGVVISGALMVAGKLLASRVVFYIACMCLYGTVMNEIVDQEKNIWNSEEVKCLRSYQTDHFLIWYSTADSISKERQARINAAVNNAQIAAWDQAVLELDEDPNLTTVFKIGRRAAKLEKKLLDQNAAYQKDLIDSEKPPLDVLLLERQMETAYDFMIKQEKAEDLGYQPDILYCLSTSDLGNASTPSSLAFWRNPYMVVKRDQNIGDPTVPTEGKNVEQLLDSQYFNRKNADDLLITATHELFHIFQNQYFSGSSSEHLKFSETSAIILEQECAKYYDRRGLTQTPYTCEINENYETYAIAIDYNHIWSAIGWIPEDWKAKEEKEKYAQYSGGLHSDLQRVKSEHLIAEGYTLSNFFLWLEQESGLEYSALEMLQYYCQYGKTMSGFFCGLFGESGNMKMLEDQWRSYLKSAGRTIVKRINDLESVHSNIDYPEYIRKLFLYQEKPFSYMEMRPRDLSLTPIRLYGEAEKEWCVFLKPDETMECMLPNLELFFTSAASGNKLRQMTRSGLAIKPGQQNYLFFSFQGVGSCGKSGYEVRYLVAPDKPKVELDPEKNTLTVTLESAPSIFSADGTTDCFLLEFKVGGKDTLRKEVEFNKADKPVVIPLDDLGLDLLDPKKVEVTVAEYIRAEKSGYPEYVGPRSETAELEFGITPLSAEMSFSGSFGEVPAIHSDSKKASFTLKADGSFTFSVPGDSGEAEPADNSGKSPFDPDVRIVQYTKWGYDGFSVSGKLDSLASPSEWTAKISDCSADEFSAFVVDIMKTVNLDGPQTDIDTSYVQGSEDDNGKLIKFESNRGNDFYGELKYQEALKKDDTYCYVTLKLYAVAGTITFSGSFKKLDAMQ